MGMQVVSEEQRVFERMRPELMRDNAGKFAVICGERLLGVYETVDEAMCASSSAFDARSLPEGAPVLITEIANEVSLCVMARPAVQPDSIVAAGQSGPGPSGAFGFLAG